MELAEGSAADIVHPEVRAHITSLVSALGGLSAEDDGKYQLGDDALEVLRDIKRWIRFYDEKTNRMDVARCIHQANLIEGDLLPILSLWPENAMDSKFRARVALACFEVMVPLTWPMERDKERMTINHHRHMPVLELAQVAYKRAIINFDGARILHTAVRAALPSMAVPIGDRTARDQGIVKLVLFFLRNMAIITPPPNVQYDGDESQVSRSATIDAFSYQDVFLFLLTVASNMGEDFRTEDTAVMEIIYHLVKRVDTEKLFMSEQQLNTAKSSELSSLMNKETSMLKAYNRKGPTRHNRFGTMIWVQREGGKMSSLSGQDALADASVRNQKMDNNKRFRPPRRGRKENKDERDLGLPVKLNPRSNDQLRSFVEDFLDSGFNPLFSHVRKTIDREAPHVMQYHRRQFFYLIAWFLEAERMRRKSKKAASQKSNDEVSSFNLVAGVLNQEMFITLNKALHEAYEFKDWHELAAVMRCFTQILLTVQDMSGCGNEDDEDIAENVLSRLFYEEATHDAIANIIRTYKDQGFDYLDAATELVHHFLRILEAYSKQNVDMQVRSRKRTRRKKAAQQEGGDDNIDRENDDSGNDEESAERATKERKFDFHRFAARFTPQGAVDTFVTFTKFYRDLSDSQLKRAHRFFYRVAFKQEMSVMLFRVDIIHLLHRMIKGPEPLDKSSGMYKEWEELSKQVLRKCFKKMEDRPELIIEMLFSKLQGIAFFLEFGYEKQTSASKAQAKPGGELEFKRTEERDQQIAIVVGALLDRNDSDHIAWVKKVLMEAESERWAWFKADEAMRENENPFGEDEEQAGANEPKSPPVIDIRPDTDERRQAMFKNSHLRLLMTLSGFARVGPASEETPDTPWVVPEDIAAEYLKDTLHYINQAEFSPPTFDEGVLAEHQLRRKTVLRKKAAFDDDEDGDLDNEMLFPVGGPTNRKAIDEPERPKKIRKRRRRNSQLEEPDDAELEDKARKRRDREREKALRIKSALYVNDGDDDFNSDEDEQFFAREREIASRAALVARTAGAGGSDSVPLPKKRKSEVLLADSDEEDDELSFARQVMSSQEDAAGESETDDTPMDGSDGEGRKRRRTSTEAADELTAETPAAMVKEVAGDDGDAEDDAPVLARRPRVRGGFVVDSDDE